MTECNWKQYISLDVVDGMTTLGGVGWLSEGEEARDFMCRRVNVPPALFEKNVFGHPAYTQIAYCALVFCVAQNAFCVFGNAPILSKKKKEAKTLSSLERPTRVSSLLDLLFLFVSTVKNPPCCAYFRLRRCCYSQSFLCCLAEQS